MGPWSEVWKLTQGVAAVVVRSGYWTVDGGLVVGPVVVEWGLVVMALHLSLVRPVWLVQEEEQEVAWETSLEMIVGLVR